MRNHGLGERWVACHTWGQEHLHCLNPYYRWAKGRSQGWHRHGRYGVDSAIKEGPVAIRGELHQHEMPGSKSAKGIGRLTFLFSLTHRAVGAPHWPNPRGSQRSISWMMAWIPIGLPGAESTAMTRTSAGGQARARPPDTEIPRHSVPS